MDSWEAEVTLWMYKCKSWIHTGNELLNLEKSMIYLWVASFGTECQHMFWGECTHYIEDSQDCKECFSNFPSIWLMRPLIMDPLVRRTSLYCIVVHRKINSEDCLVQRLMKREAASSDLIYSNNVSGCFQRDKCAQCVSVVVTNLFCICWQRNICQHN